MARVVYSRLVTAPRARVNNSRHTRIPQNFYPSAYDDIKSEGIRENMRIETGMTETSIKERSSILRMNEVVCPVLILHSETDENVPVNQAYMLRDRLTELKKDFEIKISPTGRHGQMDGNFVDNVIDFFNRRIKNGSEQSPHRK